MYMGSGHRCEIEADSGPVETCSLVACAAVVSSPRWFHTRWYCRADGPDGSDQPSGMLIPEGDAVAPWVRASHVHRTSAGVYQCEPGMQLAGHGYSHYLSAIRRYEGYANKVEYDFMRANPFHRACTTMRALMFLQNCKGV